MSLDGDSIRKCLVKKWTDFPGYGFNLHAEKGKAGQFVGKVDDRSPAEAGGLKEGDRIVEVNDVNIGNENHQQVVTRIKAGGNTVWLLVVDKAGDEYCKNNKIVISSELDQVKLIECPDTRLAEAVSHEENASNASTAEADEPTGVENDYEYPLPAIDVPAPADTNSVSDSDDADLPPPPELSELDDAVNSVSADPVVPDEQPPTPEPVVEETKEEPAPPAPVEQVVVPPPEPEVEPPKPAEPVKPAEEPSKNNSTEGAAPKLSAAEMREALARKKKNDPRNSKVSAKDKLKMFQNL